MLLANIAALVAINPAAVTEEVTVKGYATDNDGGGGLFYWSAGSALTANGGTILASTYPGATGRWIRVYSGPLNVLWYGADPTQTTDSLTAINNAMATLPTAGGEIYFPVGAYYVSAAIQTGSKNINFMGAGMMTSVITCSTVNAFNIQCASGGSISNLSIYSARTAVNVDNTLASGVSAYVNNFSMTNCFVKNNGGSGSNSIGIKLVFALKNTFTNVEVQSFTTGVKTDFKLSGPSELRSNANSWTGCKFRGSTTGVSLYHVDDQYFQGCVIENNGLGVSLDAAYGNFVSCHFENIAGPKENIRLENYSMSYTFGCLFGAQVGGYTDFIIDQNSVDKGSSIISIGDCLNSGISNYCTTACSMIYSPRNSNVPVPPTGSGITNRQVVFQYHELNGGSGNYNFEIKNWNILNLNPTTDWDVPVYTSDAAANAATMPNKRVYKVTSSPTIKRSN